MEPLNKKELNAELGKESFFKPNRIAGKVGYISGVEAFDQKLDGRLFNEVVSAICFRKRPAGLQVEYMSVSKSVSVGIPDKDISSISLEDKNQLHLMKDKSIIGRAVVGGLLFGPAGAIIGGMTGIGKKESISNLPENILSISFDENGKQSIILFEVKNKNRKVVESFFLRNYKKSFSINPVLA